MTVHLICNAHLDPAWLWELEEGAAEALSTFRIAADFCEQHEGFVFNHNEAILYEWIREYEPPLFARIKDLVAAGKWHIMGGWFLQPDCNMPSGESFVRQILVGRSFFREHFAVEPTTAINFDPFGHSRGLVQIMAGAGYDSYIVTRPGPDWLPLPANLFTWVGYDGSKVRVLRQPHGYNSGLGKAREKIERLMAIDPDAALVPVLWGIGNHGGGPSREDLRMIDELRRDLAAAAGADPTAIIHSTPEQYFAAATADAAAPGSAPPEWAGDLNPWAPGCYTSQIRIKQKHRALENSLFAVERMAVHAEVLGLAAYPTAALHAAEHDLLTAQFHDILPGSSIQPVEEAALRLLDHGLEIVSRLRSSLFFALTARYRAPLEPAIPIFAYNPHPFTVETLLECEFQPADQNWSESFTDYRITNVADGQPVPSQVEHEASNITLDWRKKVAFVGRLAPSGFTRFDCRPVRIAQKPPHSAQCLDGTLTLGNDKLQVVVNEQTGLIDAVSIAGRQLAGRGTCELVIVDDYEDPWGSSRRRYYDQIGRFTLMTREQAAEFSAIAPAAAGPVRVIEDGPARTVVEALFQYHNSYAIVTYSVPKHGDEFDVQIQLLWAEKNRMAKVVFAAAFAGAYPIGQVAFGTDRMPADGDEFVTQKWQALTNHSAGEQAADGTAAATLAVMDDGVYGAGFVDNSLQISLLHGPVYSALHLGRRPLVSGDRYHPRIDQGERFYRFRVTGGAAATVLADIDRRAAVFNERPFLLSFFPAGTSDPGADAPDSDGPTVTNSRVLCTAIKRAHQPATTGLPYVVRLQNTADSVQRGRFAYPAAGIAIDFELPAYKVATYAFDKGGGSYAVDLIERPT